MGTSKLAAGDRVSTIGLLGCGISVALATGPTDKEEEVESRKLITISCGPSLPFAVVMTGSSCIL